MYVSGLNSFESSLSRNWNGSFLPPTVLANNQIHGNVDITLPPQSSLLGDISSLQVSSFPSVQVSLPNTTPAYKPYEIKDTNSITGLNTLNQTQTSTAVGFPDWNRIIETTQGNNFSLSRINDTTWRARDPQDFTELRGQVGHLQNRLEAQEQLTANLKRKIGYSDSGSPVLSQNDNSSILEIRRELEKIQLTQDRTLAQANQTISTLQQEVARLERRVQDLERASGNLSSRSNTGRPAYYQNNYQQQQSTAPISATSDDAPPPTYGFGSGQRPSTSQDTPNKTNAAAWNSTTTTNTWSSQTNTTAWPASSGSSTQSVWTEVGKPSSNPWPA